MATVWCAVLIAVAYSAIVTFILIVVVNKTIGFKSKDKHEMEGMDSAYHGEHGYGMLNP